MAKKKRAGGRARRDARAAPARSSSQPAVRSWSVLEAQARAQLARNAEQIDATVRGTAGQAASTWRLGVAPSATRPAK